MQVLYDFSVFLISNGTQPSQCTSRKTNVFTESQWLVQMYFLKFVVPFIGSQHFVWVERVGLNGFPPPAAVWVISCEARTAARTFLFSSESVNEGHPDKLCDQARVL